MKNGFELLKTRTIEEKLNISEFEKKFNFSLPPLYKLFLATFHLGENSLKRETFLNPKYNEEYIISAPLYFPLKDDDLWFLSISHFDTLEEVYHNWESYMKHEQQWEEYGFLKIAGIGRGGGLFIGTRPENSDKIFEVVWDFDEPYFEVCENIFSLVRGLVLTEVEETLPDGFLRSDLYKNFGEKFWRVE
jgi:DNA helicase HerA-like ATPase